MALLISELAEDIDKQQMRTLERMVHSIEQYRLGLVSVQIRPHSLNAHIVTMYYVWSIFSKTIIFIEY